MRDVRVFLRRARLKAARSGGARDSRLKSGALEESWEMAAFLKGALSSTELLIPKAFKKASKKERSFGVSRGINDYLQIMKNVNLTFFNALFDYLINHSLTGKKKLINENRNLKSKNVKVPCPRVWFIKIYKYNIDNNYFN